MAQDYEASGNVVVQVGPLGLGNIIYSDEFPQTPVEGITLFSSLILDSLVQIPTEETLLTYIHWLPFFTFQFPDIGSIALIVARKVLCT